MNAYELAKLLNFDAETLNWKAFADVANMLRQQADRIAELEKVVDLLSANLVAAVEKNLTKELTDDEIKELAYQHRWNGDIDFARAKLRKAQE
jgi:hypothetical protein